MKLTTCLIVCCILANSRWTSSQESGRLESCLTENARIGKIVPITNCPVLLKIATSPLLMRDNRVLLLQKILDTHERVCCEASMISTTATTTTTATVTTTPDATSASGIIAEYDYIDLDPFSLLPKENDCGLEPADDRFTLGRAQIGQFRWAVALYYNHYTIKGVRCGGSLINTRYVLTAAQCVYSVRVEDLTLRLGKWDTEENQNCDDYDCNTEERFAKVSKKIVHPDYSRRDSDNNIALLRMDHALPENYTSYILPICMPLPSELRHDSFANSDVSVIGWGLIENGISRYKMFTELTTISNQRCEDELKKRVSDTKMCAKSLTGTNRDACGSYSGSPLQIKINGTYYLIGIISRGPPCGRTSLPTIYTRVTTYVDWILENIFD